MNAAQLIEQVHAAGGRIEAKGATLKLAAPKPLPDTLLAELRLHKPDLLAYLTAQRHGLTLAAPQEADLAENIREHFEERAAIQEHDGGFPKAKAEAEARAAMRVYEYCLTDNPDIWQIMIAPSCDLSQVARTLQKQCGTDRVPTVRERGFPVNLLVEK